jgi:predicted RNA binding protein YcfA (HicA-like mRNA interferase family)
MKVREIIRILEQDGWVLQRQRGSHMVYKHPTKGGTAVVPNHGMSKDLSIGTARNILKQADIEL